MFVGAVGELVSIGAVLPFLAIVSSPKSTVQHTQFGDFLNAMGIETPMHIAVAAAILFAIAALGATIARLSLIYTSQRFVFGVARDLGVAIFSRTLHQPYSYHTGRNSSETLAAISKAQLVIGQILLPLMQAVSASVIAIFILAGLLFIDPLIALGSGIGFAAIYLMVMLTTRAMMLANGGIIARAQEDRLQAVSEGIGGIRDILLDHSQDTFVKRFEEIETPLRNAQALNNFISQAPRLMEGIGLALIAGLTLVLTLRDGGLAAALPVLGALALGAQRLVPLMQQAYSGWAATLTGGAMLTDILEILDLPEPTTLSSTQIDERISFDRELTFKEVNFSYPQGVRPAIEGMDFIVPKGSRVGFAGRTGSGKSTLMDLVLGLLIPSNGQILVDGVEITGENRRGWQSRIAHVPQSIYLSDASIAENIAFGVPTREIDWAQVAAVAAQAELSDVIEALPYGYKTMVGERGVRLSGGQRQRIGIARALYKRADVLFFDEATSALDTQTEVAVMESIERLGRNLTVFIIAHRLSTLNGCDMVITLDAGRVLSVMKKVEDNRQVS
jgi:ABC-type multidrug transport system fused ATPase/permease subunit